MNDFSESEIDKHMNDPMKDEADKWYYDLGVLAATVEMNYAKVNAAQHKAETSRRRILVLAIFVLFTAILLSWRNEVNARRIEKNSEKIVRIQQASCEGGRQILIEFNASQNRFIKLDQENPLRGAENFQKKRIELLEQNKIAIPNCEGTIK